MRTFGGFLELEIGRPREAYHSGGLALCSGRACLNRIIDEIRPQRVHVPFYICGSLLAPLRARGIPVCFYALGDLLEPVEPIDMADGDALVVVNYFGLKDDAVRVAAQRYRGGAVIDNAQAFFARAYPDAWTFNSARKFFGVPDGGYAFGPGLGPEDRPRLDRPRSDHLIARLQGDVAGGYASYLEAEAAITAEPLGMSRLSERLMTSVDYEGVAKTRRRNYQRVHERFGSRNRLPVGLLTLGSQVPYCYPLLPTPPLPARESLWKAGLFIAVLWPDLEQHRTASFDREHRLAAELLPLPIDQRYGDADIDELCDCFEKVCKW